MSKIDNHLPVIQQILVVEQDGRAEKKISGILDFGNGGFEVKIHTVTNDLPAVIDDGSYFLPKSIAADLVLDFLSHPDLSYDLSKFCQDNAIPIVASGKKIIIKKTFAPPVCCALPLHRRLGLYGQRFGLPEFIVTIEAGIVTQLSVKRGAPCGATWCAAQKVIGLPYEKAGVQIGLETQFFCFADPAGWDPIHGKSPVHLAGHLHRAAFMRGVANATYSIQDN